MMTASRLHPIGLLGLQAFIVIFSGITFAVMANFLSPWGLELSRSYFPPAATPAIQPTANIGAAPSPIPTHEFSTVTTDGLVEMLRDKRFVTRRFLLIDARNDAHFRSGHIEGALQFDHFQPQNHLSAVMPACLAAEKIVIYCTGGSCEDSLFAARMLRDFGIPADRFSIFIEGIQAWKDAGLPLTLSAP